MTSRHALQMAGLVASVLIFGALMYWIINQDTRSPDALALAYRCVDELHAAHGAALHVAPDLAAQCDRYFRLRSDAEAAADERRWQDRHKQSGGTAGPP